MPASFLEELDTIYKILYIYILDTRYYTYIILYTGVLILNTIYILYKTLSILESCLKIDDTTGSVLIWVEVVSSGQLNLKSLQ